MGLPKDNLEAFLPALRQYEHNAARFGLQLMHEAGITDLDHWLFDFAETDWRYVEHFYREGSIPPWESCLVHNAPALEPLPIPELQPRLVEERFAF
jgi:hypothetical protein